MKVTVKAIQLAQTGSVIYMLSWGAHYERGSSGPYIGVHGLDFDTLVKSYRRDSYAAANAAKEDYCWLNEDGFIGWLVRHGILTPIETTDVELDVRNGSDDVYVPLHWPKCPECAEGRGEQQYRDARKSLNRVVEYRRCIECGHEWGHHDVPNNSKLPMLEDDGRDTKGGCVPFAISKACGIDWATVRDVCTKYGWSIADGMLTPHNAVLAAKELGYELVSHDVPRKGLNQPTLKQVASQLAGGRNYIIGLRGHWLALVNGRLVDNDNNSGMTSRVIEVFEVRKAQAIAA